ncbi:MAG: hypothetical protein ACKOC8_07805 [Pirellulales bacterium]
MALPTAARAGGDPGSPAGAAGVMAEAGASSREARRRASDAVPLSRMRPAERQIAEEAVRQTTLHRRLPAVSVGCDAALLDFVLAKPETLVDVWRVLGISRLELDPTGPGRWRMADGYGTTGAIRLLHHERHDRGGVSVFHGRGSYDGPLSPKPLTGSCLVVVRHTTAAAQPPGRPRQTVEIDAFLDVDGLGLELVTRTLQPIIVRSAAANMHEIGLFVSQFAAAANRNPAAVARIADRMTRTDPQDRRTLVALASGGAALPGSERTADRDDVQHELASRWMTVDQLDAVSRR